MPEYEPPVIFTLRPFHRYQSLPTVGQYEYVARNKL